MAINLSAKNELQWIKEGRVFAAQAGLLTTPATFTATDIVWQTPDLQVRAPAGIVIVPLRVQVAFEATGGAAEDIVVAQCNNNIGVTNMTANTPYNCNSRYADKGSSCTAYISATDVTGTAPTGIVVLKRAYIQPDIDAITGTAHFQQFVFSPLHGKGTPGIVGDDSKLQTFLVYVANATSSTGYVMAQWAEFTYTEFYAA